MDDISRLSRYIKVRDPAVDAWKRVLAACEDDVAYEVAIVEFEKAVPTSFRGVVLKSKLEWQRLRALLQGDRLTASGRQMMRAFRKTIDVAQLSLAKQARRHGFFW